jgi:hypothetical protein
VTKVRNVERAGGSLAVIIDDGNSDIANVVMSDDGTGTGILIPSMLISRKDGEKLKDYLKSASQEDAYQAALQVEFVLENHDNTVKW